MRFGDWMPKWVKTFKRDLRASVDQKMMSLFFGGLLGGYLVPKAIIAWVNASTDLTTAGADATTITLVTEVVPIIIAIASAMVLLAVARAKGN